MPEPTIKELLADDVIREYREAVRNLTPAESAEIDRVLAPLRIAGRDLQLVINARQ